jgi:hypothetical protein
VAEVEFNLAYDGPAVETGRMPVQDLAPALLALGEFFAETSRTLYPERDPVALSIQATDTGSFLVRLILEGRAAWDQFAGLLDSGTGNALANLEAIGFLTFLIIKRIAGRKIDAQEPAPAPGHIRLTLEDGTSLDIPSQVLTLYENPEVRRQARRVVSPLHRDGVDEVRLEDPDPTQESVVIDKTDLPAFDTPSDEEALLELETEMFLEIVRLSFQRGSNWRFTDGTKAFSAPVEDEDFWDRVEDGAEAFRSGDTLHCRVRIIQSHRDGKLHTEYRILQVLVHMPRGIQMRLDEGNDAPRELPPGSRLRADTQSTPKRSESA